MPGLFLILIAAATAPTQPTQPRIRLNTGAEMPFANGANGGGTANFTEWLRQGGRGLDSALCYIDRATNKSKETQIAEALEAFPEIKDEVFVTTMVPCCAASKTVIPEMKKWCDYRASYHDTIAGDMRKNNALVETTPDLTLLHQPCDTVEHTIQRWLEMEAALAAGLTKAIGVSNFNAELLAAIAADGRTTITPAVNQCNYAIGNHDESHMPESGGDDKTMAYCKQHGISYMAYSPLEGKGGHGDKPVYAMPEVVAIAKVHNVTGGQVGLKWLVQQNITFVTTPNDPEYIAEDLDLWSFDLTDEEMAKLSAL